MLIFASLINMFAAAGACTKGTFLGLVPWYQYLTIAKNDLTGRCEVTSINVGDPAGVLSGDSLGIWRPVILITLAVVDDLLRIAALVALGYVIYGGFRYMTSQGAPDATAKAQHTVMDAVAGLVICLFAIAIVSFLGRTLAK